MQHVFAEVEAATLELEEHGLGFAFPTPSMLMQHWTPQPLDDAFARVQHRYLIAQDWARSAEAGATPAGRPLARYWRERLNFGFLYLEAVREIRLAAAEAAGKPDDARRSAEFALKKLRQGLESYANVARDRSDRGAIAVMAEYAYRPLAAKIAKLAKPPKPDAAKSK
jgi:hypothetical protein